ncbi:MAG TPA: SMP-30/gluconolactonase/LRE family protein, partial [Quisquiliibacterium sp.]|nr:SMP-30/gluconolactonase/LRE family protein [Quisquiliibacterium sp.]
MRIREIATGLEFPEGPVAMDDGSVLLVEIARGTLTRVTPDGRASVVAQLGGGPNGAAIGPDGAVYVTNNGGFRWTRLPNGQLRPGYQADDYEGGRIERVNLATGRFERVYTACGVEKLRGPNDLVFDAHGSFYFSDLGKNRPRDSDRGALYYAKPDGSDIQCVAPSVVTPNGIGLSPDGKTLYYAETEGARLWAMDLAGPGKVDRRRPPAPPGVRALASSPGGHHQY